MVKLRENKRYLPNVIIPNGIVITNDISEVVHNKDLLVLSIPSHGVRNLNSCRNYIKKEQ